jgi:hypothetical protein
LQSLIYDLYLRSKIAAHKRSPFRFAQGEVLQNKKRADAFKPDFQPEEVINPSLGLNVLDPRSQVFAAGDDF